jgi:hypothetical protein
LKYILLLLFFSPVLTKSQDVAGFFVHDWYYIDKTDLLKNKITTINIITKGNENWTDQIMLNENARKITQTAIREDGSDTVHYDAADVWYYAAPSKSETTINFIYSDSVLTRIFPNRTIKTKFNKLNQPVEEWLLQENIKVTRKFNYNSNNLLDTIFNIIERDNKVIGKDFYVYHYGSGKLSLIIHFLQLGNDIILSGVINYNYNRAGLIKNYTGKFKDHFALKVNVEYLSGDRRIK